jgi:hypothetical protein
MKIRALVVLALAFFVASCASYFTRKECEKLNWYQVGYDAALRGDRISNDDQVSKCRKAEAEISESQLDVGFKAGMSRYCQPDGVFQTGKSGDLFNTDFCEPGQLSLLKKKHNDGLTAYCQDGKSAGLSGKKYKNVCAPAFEKTFLPEYRKGRKQYLQGMVQNAESKLQSATSDLNRMSMQKSMADSRLAALPYVKPGDQDPYASMRSQLSSEASNLSWSISQKSQEKAKLQAELDTYKQEIVTLD